MYASFKRLLGERERLIYIYVQVLRYTTVLAAVDGELAIVILYYGLGGGGRDGTTVLHSAIRQLSRAP